MCQWRKSGSRWAIWAILVAVLSLSQAATATEYSVNGTPVLADNYEAPDVADSPPVADIGAWTTIQEGVVVTDNATTPSPGAAEGSQYLAIKNSGVGGVALHTLAAPAATPGDVVRVETMAYLPEESAGNDHWYQMVWFDTSGTVSGVGNSPIHTSTLGDGTVVWYDGAAYQSSTTQITRGQWQKWEIEYVVGADSWSWLIDGVGDTGMGFNSRPTDVGIGSIQFFANGAAGDTPLYFDAPEPTALVLLACGALGLVARRRRRA